MLSRYEYVLTGAWILLALFLSRGNGRWYRPRRLFRLLGRQPALDLFFVGLVATGASATVSLAVDWPEPRVHDEFSYLLAADTFSQGRLTNPSHPLSKYFETFHVNQAPTYCSIYPPGQGLMLALGQVVGGHPLVGVWVSFGLACAAVCWMLQGLVPGRWAVAGGLLAALRFGFLAGDAPGYWSQSYWGGAVAMMGGALAFGACQRLTREPRARYAALLAAGLLVLANSRPFEGAVFSGPIAIALLAWLARRGVEGRVQFARVLLPLSLLLATGLAAMAAYNIRCTGNPFRMPYQQNGITYAMVPLFLWEPLKAEPLYNHAVIRDYHLQWAVPAYQQLRGFDGYITEIGSRLRTLVNFYVGPLLFLPLLALPGLAKKSWTAFAALECMVLLLAFSLTTWLQPHYAAPATGCVVMLVVQGLRRLRLWRPAGRPLGAALVWTLPITYSLLVAVSLADRLEPRSESWHLRRAALLSELQGVAGRHLVIVSYGPGHSPHEEWVFNGADIDQAKVVWARDMRHPGALTENEANGPLLSYFRDRSTWFLDADQKPHVLEPYTKVSGSAR